MSADAYVVTAEVWLHSGDAGWHFLTLPDEVADELSARFAERHRPFGSLPVKATLGGSTWATSLFTDRRRGSYVLPLKAQVRARERVEAGQLVTVTLEPVTI